LRWIKSAHDKAGVLFLNRTWLREAMVDEVLLVVLAVLVTAVMVVSDHP
jgi:hypothetical protein